MDKTHTYKGGGGRSRGSIFLSFCDSLNSLMIECPLRSSSIFLNAIALHETVGKKNQRKHWKCFNLYYIYKANLRKSLKPKILYRALKLNICLWRKSLNQRCYIGRLKLNKCLWRESSNQRYFIGCFDLNKCLWRKSSNQRYYIGCLNLKRFVEEELRPFENIYK